MPLAVALLTVSCAAAPSTQIQSQFPDLPLPRAIAYQAGRSLIVDSPNAKAAHLVFRGRVEAESLALGMRASLEAQGWRHVSSSSDRGRVVQVYDRGGQTVQLEITEGLWFTYLAVDVSEPQPGPPLAPRAAAESGIPVAEPVSSTPGTTGWQKIRETGRAVGLGVRNFVSGLFTN
jgi:hypothetical protein